MCALAGDDAGAAFCAARRTAGSSSIQSMFRNVSKC
jgi:hypothetical protein